MLPSIGQGHRKYTKLLFLWSIFDQTEVYSCSYTYYYYSNGKKYFEQFFEVSISSFWNSFELRSRSLSSSLFLSLSSISPSNQLCTWMDEQGLKIWGGVVIEKGGTLGHQGKVKINNLGYLFHAIPSRDNLFQLEYLSNSSLKSCETFLLTF